MEDIDELFGIFEAKDKKQSTILNTMREQLKKSKEQKVDPEENDASTAKISRIVSSKQSIDDEIYSERFKAKEMFTYDTTSSQESSTEIKQQPTEVQTTVQLNGQNIIQKEEKQNGIGNTEEVVLTDLKISQDVPDNVNTSAALNSINVETAMETKVNNDKNSVNNELAETVEKDIEDAEYMLECLPKQTFLRNIIIRVLDAPDTCSHEVAVLSEQDYLGLEEGITKPAKEYNFVLDAFQQRAILCIDNEQSVLVSAHTSAGKTVVAEYAVARSLMMKQRVIYTTPIKALSNQKFREFKQEFGDVGIITGDVTINPSASCLIMTTEILRIMIYRGSKAVREVGWVIFDEIHYMTNKERGVVWEESLILLPDKVRFVFLSATIPNARQFAEWVASLHEQPCHVVYTEYRPTPLQHYIFPSGGDGIYQIVGANGAFREENFKNAMSIIEKRNVSIADTPAPKLELKEVNTEQLNISKILKMVMENKLAPVIIFAFSKRECETYAMQTAKLDFNIEAEKELIMEVFNNAISVLNEGDRNLPQIHTLLPLLLRGIGIHHGGLLPILKEIVEILFGEGFLKVLFATETFAMGLNMPARTVVFSALQKFDGQIFRWISSGEYIQMAGRAGRRGLDDKGIVILMINEEIAPATIRSIVKGQADPIISEFHLSYNMVLNLLRVEGINPEYMLERSFRQFRNQRNIPQIFNQYKEKQKELTEIIIPDEGNVITYHNIRTKLEDLNKKFMTWLTRPQYIKPFMQRGRLLKIKNTKYEYDWGVVINLIEEKRGNPSVKSGDKFDFQILIHIVAGTEKNEFPKPYQKGEKGNMEVIKASNDNIISISSLRVYVPNQLRQSEHRLSVVKMLGEIKRRFPKGIPRLNAKIDMKIKSNEFDDIIILIKIFEDRLYKHPLYTSSTDSIIYPLYLKKLFLQDELQVLRDKIKDARSLLQMNELHYRTHVLRRLEYLTAFNVIELKGRVACELSAADELLLTELIFNGVFNDLTSSQIASLLSCFVCDEKISETSKLSVELAEPLRIVQKLARRIAKISRACKLPLNEDEYLENIRPTLMEVIYNWCKGDTFTSICKQTNVFEGCIIRTMRRLEELLRQMCQAAKTIGNTELDNKFYEGIKLLKRDIAFTGSLYL